MSTVRDPIIKTIYSKQLLVQNKTQIKFNNNKVRMNSIQVFSPVPSHLKLPEQIRTSLSEFAARCQPIKILNKIRRKASDAPLTPSWHVFVEGSAYFGQLTRFDERKSGFGKMIDTKGRFLAGYFEGDRFCEGLVINTRGDLYAVMRHPSHHLEYNLNMKNSSGHQEEDEEWEASSHYTSLKKTKYIYKNQDQYHGEVRNCLPNGFGVLFYHRPVKVPKHDVHYKSVKGQFKDGQPHGRCLIDFNSFGGGDRQETLVLFEHGKMTYVVRSEGKNTITYHNCEIEKADKHTSTTISKFDGSVLFHGMSSLIGQNGEGYNFTIEFSCHSNKTQSLTSCIKRGLEYREYTSSGSFLETDWRHDNQIAIGKQFMRYSGVIVEAEWALSSNQIRIMEIRRVLTKQGGDYTREGPEADQFVYMQIKEKMIERSRKPEFELVRKNHNYYITINSAFNASIFSQIQICSGPSIKEINKMISYTISGMSEGQAKLDLDYYTGEFHGRGYKSQYLLNYTFDGEFVCDEPIKGMLDSSFLHFKGRLKDYTLIKGSVQLLFTEGYKFKGNLNKEGADGFGELVFPDGTSISSAWSRGVCWKNPHIAIIHGDQKRKLHRYCLLILDKEHNEGFMPDKNQLTKDGKIKPSAPQKSSRLFEKGAKIKRGKCTILTSLIYNKKYAAESIELDTTDCCNLRLKAIKGAMETMSLTLHPFREFERISNDSINGKKYITKCVYHTLDQVWVKKGIFTAKIHKIDQIEISNSKRGMKILINFSRSLIGSIGKVKDLSLGPQDRYKISKFLGIKNIQEEAEFRYGVFNELEERVIISKTGSEAAQEDSQGGLECEGWRKLSQKISSQSSQLFDSRAVLFHLNGDMSFGRVKHNFLHGPGTRIYNTGQIQKIKGRWVVDQPVGIVEVFYRNGAVYKGHLKFLQRHGEGKIRYKNGEEYDGEWFSGMKHGNGRYSWPDGSRYEGSFKLNMMWGYGSMMLGDGRCVEGKFWRNEILSEKKIFDQNGIEE